MNVISKDAIVVTADELRRRLQGRYLTPEDSNWDEARVAWNLAVDQRPAAVAIPETADGTVLVKTHLMRDLTPDAVWRRRW